MIDKKSMSVLKVLNKLANNSAYKVVNSDEILANLSQKSQYDQETIRQIMDFLEKQEYLNIKFCEENTYCYSLTPKARICIEQNSDKDKSKKTQTPVMTYVYVMIASFIGSLLAMLLFFSVNF